MFTKDNKTQIIILAAGRGKRFGSIELPKVLVEINGRPMIDSVMEKVSESKIGKPLAVIGFQGDLVIERLKDRADFVWQHERLGTGHAVAVCEKFIDPAIEKIIVLYGDMPCLSAQTIVGLNDLAETEDEPMAMITIKADDFSDWRAGLFGFGRILRNEADEIIGIKEKKDATPEELKIKELNPSQFCFDRKWLFENLKKLNKNNAQGEYYLTDLVEIAVADGHKILNMEVDPKECLGVNTEEERLLVEKFLSKKL
ncbi:MAG TPA: NTP transferase domain-containing protein [Candidatus Bipolaricaulota bacterium]|nr:NTP transferase domain-containing protein [Candidatus Bipolaricaulota bacterium]